MKHTLSYIKLILTDLKLIFSYFMTGENTDCHSEKVKTASNLPDGSVPKDRAQSETYQHHSKISNLVFATGKHRKSAKKPNKI